MDKKPAPSQQYLHESREALGRQIRALREKKGISTEELAGMMEIHTATISKIESGKFSPTLDILARLGWYLDFRIGLEEEVRTDPEFRNHFPGDK